MHRDGITEMKPPIAIDANHFARLFALSSLTSKEFPVKAPQIVQQQQITPTLTVRPGTSISIFVARDLDFTGAGARR